METLNIEFATVSSSELSLKICKNMEMRSTIAVRFAADDEICTESRVMFGYSRKLMSSFRFQARYGLFTYSQCGRLRPQRVSEHYTALGADFIIGREAHSDGGTHLHVFADFKRKFRTRDSRKFDVEDFHPNIVPSLRNPAGGWDYATKDGDICGGELRRPESTGGSEGSRQNDGWDRLRTAESRDEFFRIASEHLFSHLVKSFNSFSAYADWKFRVDRSPYVHNPEFTFSHPQLDGLREWVGQLFTRREHGMYRTLHFRVQSVS